MSSEAESAKPNISAEVICNVLRQHYGFHVKVGKELKSFSAQNYVVSISSIESEFKIRQKFLVKILNLEEAQDELLDTRFKIMEDLRKQGFVCQKLVQTSSGRNSVVINSSGKQGDIDSEYKICVMEFLKGTELFHLSPWQPELLREVGTWIAQLRKSLKQMAVPPLLRRSSKNCSEEVCGNAEWKLSNLSDLRKHYDSLEESHRSIAESVIKKFEEKVVPVLDKLPTGLIHGDMHDENILLLTDTSKSWEANDVKKKFGLIDFEDVHESCCIIDFAAALCYFMIASKCNDILSVSGNILAGYLLEVTLTTAEWSALYSLVCGRYIQELVLSEVELQKQNKNEYLRTCFEDGWPQIERLINWGEEYVVSVWRTYS